MPSAICAGVALFLSFGLRQRVKPSGTPTWMVHHAKSNAALPAAALAELELSRWPKERLLLLADAIRPRCCLLPDGFHSLPPVTDHAFWLDTAHMTMPRLGDMGSYAADLATDLAHAVHEALEVLSVMRVRPGLYVSDDLGLVKCPLAMLLLGINSVVLVSSNQTSPLANECGLDVHRVTVREASSACRPTVCMG